MKSTERVILESLLTPDAPANSLLPLDAIEAMDADLVANTERKRNLMAQNLGHVCKSLLKLKGLITGASKTSMELYADLRTLDQGIITGYMLGKYGSTQNEFLDQLATTFRMARQAEETKNPEFYEGLKKQREEFIDKSLKSVVGKKEISPEFAEKARKMMTGGGQ